MSLNDAVRNSLTRRVPPANFPRESRSFTLRSIHGRPTYIGTSTTACVHALFESNRRDAPLFEPECAPQRSRRGRNF